MAPVTATARAAALAKKPLRMAFLYVPNGAHMQDWTPKEQGKGYALPHILEPLAPFKDDMLVLTGLTQDKSRAERRRRGRPRPGARQLPDRRAGEED